MGETFNRYVKYKDTCARVGIKYLFYYKYINYNFDFVKFVI